MTWLESMEKKYGGAEGVKAEMKRRAQLRKNIVVPPGFKGDSTRAREIGKIGLDKRWKKQSSYTTKD